MRRTPCGGSAYRAAMGSPLILPPPPRHVPVGLCAVLATVFAGMSEPLVDPFGAGARQTQGRVTRVEPTGATVNGRRVHAVAFEWPASDPTRTATSYTEAATPAPGDSIAIEWLPGEPPIARAVGMRSALLPAFARFVFAFPALGAAIVVAAAWAGWRRVRALAAGDCAMAERVSATPTNMRVNRRIVHVLAYRFLDARGVERTASTRSHRFDPTATREALLVEADGARITRLADLPVALRCDRDGQIEPPSFGALALALLPPTLVAVGWSLAQTISP